MLKSHIRIIDDEDKNSVVLSIIIVTYKCYPLLKNCISSIYRNNDIGMGIELIVVDNAPETERIEEIIKDFPMVKYVTSENNGFGAGNNKGAELAQGKYLLFLNPDTIIVEPIFKSVINTFEQSKEIGIIGCKLVKDNHAVISMNFKLRFGIAKHVLSKVCNKFDIFNSNHMYVSGANMFIRKVAFQNAGAFDDKIFMYGEEFDLTERINRLGFKTKYMCKNKIVHLEGGSSKSINTEKYRRSVESYIYVLRKHKYNYIKECKKELFFLHNAP